MSTERRLKQVRREVAVLMQGKMREVWASFAKLPLKERAKMAWWLLKGQAELPKGGE